jgi:hypothetical protein
MTLNVDAQNWNVKKKNTFNDDQLFSRKLTLLPTILKKTNNFG